MALKKLILRTQKTKTKEKTTKLAPRRYRQDTTTRLQGGFSFPQKKVSKNLHFFIHVITICIDLFLIFDKWNFETYKLQSKTDVSYSWKGAR